jgi:hypothetical protein
MSRSSIGAGPRWPPQPATQASTLLRLRTRKVGPAAVQLCAASPLRCGRCHVRAPGGCNFGGLCLLSRQGFAGTTSERLADAARLGREVTHTPQSPCPRSAEATPTRSGPTFLDTFSEQTILADSQTLFGEDSATAHRTVELSHCLADRGISLVRRAYPAGPSPTPEALASAGGTGRVDTPPLRAKIEHLQLSPGCVEWKMKSQRQGQDRDDLA